MFLDFAVVKTSQIRIIIFDDVFKDLHKFEAFLLSFLLYDVLIPSPDDFRYQEENLQAAVRFDDFVKMWEYELD